MQEVKQTKKEQTPIPEGSFSMKLGNTTYTVEIHFSNTSTATLEDKVKQILTREIKEKCFAISE